MCPGRAEFGPRALGHRSLLGDPRNPEMQTRMSVAIKFRESFRPFAPSVVEGKQSGYFDLTAESPYMLLVTPVREDKRCPLPPEKEKLTGLAKLKTVRSDLPAVTHRANLRNLFTFMELTAENCTLKIFLC